MNKESSNFYKLLAIRQLGLLCVYTRCPARRRRDLLSHHWWETSLAVHHRVFNARFCVSLFESVLLRGECWPILSVREPAHWRLSLKWCHVAVSEWQRRYEIEGNRKKPLVRKGFGKCCCPAFKSTYACVVARTSWARQVIFRTMLRFWGARTRQTGRTDQSRTKKKKRLKKKGKLKRWRMATRLQAWYRSRVVQWRRASYCAFGRDMEQHLSSVDFFVAKLRTRYDQIIARVTSAVRRVRPHAVVHKNIHLSYIVKLRKQNI